MNNLFRRVQAAVAMHGYRIDTARLAELAQLLDGIEREKAWISGRRLATLDISYPAGNLAVLAMARAQARHSKTVYLSDVRAAAVTLGYIAEPHEAPAAEEAEAAAAKKSDERKTQAS